MRMTELSYFNDMGHVQIAAEKHALCGFFPQLTSSMWADVGLVV